MRITSEQGIALIKRFEGFSAEPYFCPAGKRTIGYGHVIKEIEDFGDYITPQEGEILLKQDVSHSEQAIHRFVTVDLTQGQFDALVSFIYNVGEKAFEKSTLLRNINDENMEKAAAQFARWVFANGKKMPGLAARRAAETQIFQS